MGLEPRRSRCEVEARYLAFKNKLWATCSFWGLSTRAGSVLMQHSYRITVEYFTLPQEREESGRVAALLTSQLSFGSNISSLYITPMSESRLQSYKDAMSSVDPSLHRFGMGPIAVEGQTALLESPIEFSSGYENSFCTGVLHLYKATTPPEQGSGNVIVYPPGSVCAVLAVPSSFSSADFIHWLGSWANLIQHYRFLRDGSPDRYLCLLQFARPTTTASFMSSLQGRPYSSFHGKQCHIVPIHSVEIRQTTISDSILQTFYAKATTPVKHERSLSTWIELPTCPICLERMDSDTCGIMTTFCHHSFHCRCLSEWDNIQCPVCRNAMTSSFNSQSGLSCHQCSASNRLWICLICGHIGCDRYQKAHAQSHFQSTNHLYALDMTTHHVWDYAGDCYVHRLYQNKEDGKLLHQDRVDLVQDQISEMIESGPSKSSNVPLASLMALQSESQMSYLGQYTDQLHSEHNQRIQEAEKKYQQDRSVQQSQIQSLQQQIEASNTKIHELQEKLKEQQDITEEEKMLSSKLQQAIENLERQICSKQSMIEDLESQISDLCLHFQAQEAIDHCTSSGTAHASIQLGSRGKAKKGNRKPH